MNGYSAADLGYALAMLLTPRDIETFTALNRYRYLRANFLHRLVGGSKQNVCRRLGILYKHGYLARPHQQLQSYNARYSPRVYELTPKSKAILQAHGISLRDWQGEMQFWHRLMVADIVSSFEMLAKMHGLTFKDQWDLLGDAPLTIPASITWDKLHSNKALQPDALFAIGNTHFLLEADRGTEPLERQNLNQTSYLRKLLCYRDILLKKTPQHIWGFSPLVLNVTTKRDRIPNILDLFKAVASQFGQTNPKVYSMAFMAKPILGSFEKHPEPLLSLFDDLWDRVGYPPLVIRKEVENGHAKTT